jgi:Flp pilus assembly protein TadD
VVLLRRPVRFAPELLLFVLPAAVVALFFYSPRYRLPMAPASAVLAAWGLVNAVQVRRRAGWSVAVGAALGGAIGLAAWNRASGFDPIEPRLASLHNQLGRLLWDEGKPAAALEHLSASLRIDPNRVMVRTFLAGCQRALGRYDEALAEYERARQLAAFDVDAVIGMAGTLVEMRRYGRAEELLREAAAAVPDSLPFQLELARVLLKQQKWAEALAAYSRIAQIAPEHVESQRAIGIAADQLGRFEIAKAAFERALALQPGDPGILRNLGVLHARNKRFAEAAEYFRQALKSAPGDADLQNDLTRVEAMPGGTGPTP